MSINIGGLGGWGGGKYDPNMGDKINQLLAGKKSRADQIDDFLQKELGVDPKTLPLAPADAKAALTNYVSSHSVATCQFIGNSVFGLTTVVTHPESGDDPHILVCPSCGETGGDWENLANREWECSDCGTVSVMPAATAVVTEITEPHTGTPTESDQWREFTRWYRALSPANGRKFQMVKDDTNWQDRFKIEPIIEEAVNPNPDSYSTDTMLLIVNGTEQEVVRVGTLFADTGFTILRTMKPMTDVTGWTVKEVL